MDLNTTLKRLITWSGNPWYLASPGAGAMGRLHRLAARHALVMRFGSRARWVKLALTLAWPLRLALQAPPVLRHFGPAVQMQHHRSVLRQLVDLLYLGIVCGLPPLAYYRYRLFLSENRKRLGQYLFEHEAPALFSFLNGFKTDPVVEDKRLFADRCTEAGLPVAPTLAWGEGGHIHGLVEAWPDGDLVSKPTGGSQGRGVLLWRAESPGRYNDGRSEVARDALPAVLAQIYADEGWLLQPALVNHPALADLSHGPMVTLRIMTGRGPDGTGLAFSAVLKMPFRRQPTSTHGLGSAVDLARGTLGPAFSYRPLHPGCDRHPGTDAVIAGRVVPDWQAAIRLAERAHALLPHTRLLGWDIALTAAGPILLETNSGWDVAMPQIAAQAPLGHTRLPGLCAEDVGSVATAVMDSQHDPSRRRMRS